MTGDEEALKGSPIPDASSPLPDEFFIFVNQANPMAVHNYRVTSTFSSRFAHQLYADEGRRALDEGRIDPMPFAPNPNADPSLSPFTVSAMNNYRIEWDAELGQFDVAARDHFHRPVGQHRRDFRPSVCHPRRVHHMISGPVCALGNNNPSRQCGRVQVSALAPVSEFTEDLKDCGLAHLAREQPSG